MTHSFSRAGLGGIVHALVDAVQDVEQQRLEQRRVRAHRLEVEDLQPVERQRVARGCRTAPRSARPRSTCAGGRQGARQQVGQREQPPLAAVEDVQVLDGLVELAVLGSLSR